MTMADDTKAAPARDGLQPAWLDADWDKGGGLLPAIIQDARTGQILMLGYMNREAAAVTVDSGDVTFFSRSKQRLWTKGETSGNKLGFVSAVLDCDRDTILVQAVPAGPACHTGARSCFTDDLPQGAGFLGQLLLVFDDLDNLPPVTFGVLCLVGIHVGSNMRFDKIAHAVAPIGLTFSGFEIHGGIPLVLIQSNLC